MENYSAKVMHEPLNLPLGSADMDLLSHFGVQLSEQQYAEHQQWLRHNRELDRNGHGNGIFYHEQSIQWVLQRLQHHRSFQPSTMQRTHERFEHQQHPQGQHPQQQRTQHQQRTNYQQSYNNINNSPSHSNRHKVNDRDRRDRKTRHNNNNNTNNNNNNQNFKNRDWHHNGKSNSLTSEGSKRNHNQAYRSLSPTPPSSSKSSSPAATEKCFEKDVEDSLVVVNYEQPSYAGVIRFSNSAPLLVSEPLKQGNHWNEKEFVSLRGVHSISAEHLNLPQQMQFTQRPPAMKRAVTRSPVYDPEKPFEYYLARCGEVEMREAPPTLRTGGTFDRLSLQMWEKFQSFQQSRNTYKSKMVVWKDLHDAVQNFPPFDQRAFPKWGLFLVGSTISGFGLDSSDVDMCLVAKTNHHSVDARVEAMVTLNELKVHLENSMSTFQHFSLINAKVPILRFRDSTNLIEIDLNYNNCIGVRNTQLLFSYSQIDWRLRPLALLVKLWAQHHNINDARKSTISSYSLVLMVIHFLQNATKPAVLPCLHDLCPEKFGVLHDITTIDMVEKCDVKWQSKNRQPIGELFLRFLDYYSNFAYKNYAISVRTGGILPIEMCRNARSIKNDPNQWLTLCIEEPFDLTNTARSVYDPEIFERIRFVFFTSFHRLKETLNLESVFQESLFMQLPPQPILNHIKYMMFPQPVTLQSTVAADIVKS